MQDLLSISKMAALAGALAVAGACGGGDPPNNPDPDGAPDAPNVVPAEARSGTVAVLDLALTNPGVNASGATVSISFTDLENITVQPVVGSDPPGLGQCTVWVYDAADARPQVDEGPVTIAGARVEIPECRFRNGSYQCVAAEGAVPVNSTFGAEAGGLAVVNPLGVDIDDSAIGQFLETKGFSNPAHNGVFPIVDASAASVTVAGIAPGTGPEVVEAGSSAEFAIIAGEGPHPAQIDFLDDAQTAITIEGAGGPIVPAFTLADITASGEGLALDDESTQLHEIPGEAQDVRFGCDGTNGDCGVNGSGGSGIVGFVFSGSTTDADHAGLPDTVFLPPVNSYAEFQCRGQLGANSITLTEEALGAILSTGPTRISAQLIRITAALGLAEQSTSAVVGHGLVGITNLQP